MKNNGKKESLMQKLCCDRKYPFELTRLTTPAFFPSKSKIPAKEKKILQKIYYIKIVVQPRVKWTGEEKFYCSIW